MFESVKVLQCRVMLMTLTQPSLSSAVLQQGGAEIVQLLLEAGADPDKPTPEGNTPLAYPAV